MTSAQAGRRDWRPPATAVAGDWRGLEPAGSRVAVWFELAVVQQLPEEALAQGVDVFSIHPLWVGSARRAELKRKQAVRLVKKLRRESLPRLATYEQQLAGWGTETASARPIQTPPSCA